MINLWRAVIFDYEWEQTLGIYSTKGAAEGRIQNFLSDGRDHHIRGKRVEHYILEQDVDEGPQ